MSKQISTIVEVSNCLECPYIMYRGIRNQPWCRKSEKDVHTVATAREDTDYEIPNWCELDDSFYLISQNAKLVADLKAAKGEAESLASSMYRRYYMTASPNFELCDSVPGVISQIDNMAAGLGERNDRLVAALEEVKARHSIEGLYDKAQDKTWKIADRALRGNKK